MKKKVGPHKFIVLIGQVICSDGQPFEIVYGYDGECFKDRDDAIAHGFQQRGSDDFNIGVLDRGKLVSLDWMEKPVDTDPEILKQIASQIGL